MACKQFSVEFDDAFKKAIEDVRKCIILKRETLSFSSKSADDTCQKFRTFAKMYSYNFRDGWCNQNPYSHENEGMTKEYVVMSVMYNYRTEEYEISTSMPYDKWKMVIEM